MNFPQIIKCVGIAICLWELLKSRINSHDSPSRETPSLTKEEIIAIQKEILNRIKAITTPRVSESERDFYVTLAKNYYFDSFTVGEVKPSYWSLQKTVAIVRQLCQNDILRHYVKEGKTYYEFPLDKWGILW